MPIEYEPTLDWFVYVASLVNAAKPDFMCARAMSNSDLVIDYTQMRKGDKLTVMSLVRRGKGSSEDPGLSDLLRQSHAP